MKLFSFHILPLFVAAVFFLSCEKSDDCEDKEKSKSVFVYMVADNDLDYYGVENIIDMQKGMPENVEGRLIVYLDRAKNGNPAHPCLYEIRHDTAEYITSKIICVYPECNSCTVECFEKVLGDAELYCRDANTEIKRLVFWSHGTGWLPSKALQTRVKSFGLDQSNDETGDELDIMLLSEALEDRHFEYIVMDACFMGGIETAYQLRNIADYLILSPSEILSKGFPYREITAFLVDNQNKARQLCTAFYDFYSVRQNAFQSATITLVETKHLGKLAETMSYFYKNTCSVIPTDSVLEHIPQYDRTNSFIYFDFVGYINSCCRDSALKFEIINAYDSVVRQYCRTDKMFSMLDLTITNGLSIYIPNNYCQLSIYEDYKKLDWAIAVAAF